MKNIIIEKSTSAKSDNLIAMENSKTVLSTDTVSPDSIDKSEEELVMNDTYFASARGPISVEGMKFSFMKPPHMIFNDQNRAKNRLNEAFEQKEFLLLFGYSGCGKTTIMKQFMGEHSGYVFYFPDFVSMSKTQMLVEMGECVGLSLAQRTSYAQALKKQLAFMPGVMFLFDEVAIYSNADFLKIDQLRKINMESGVPICICGVPYLYKKIYNERQFDKYCSIRSRLDECEMNGMQRKDAGNYLNMLAKTENIKFTYIAQQRLIEIALNPKVGGIHAFTTVIGRCITVARVKYYTSPGRSFPDSTQCIRSAIPGAKIYPGSELILTPPTTPEPILIDEWLIEGLLGEYKSHFPKATVSREE